MIKKLLATLGVIILFTSAAFAQSQIKGKVTDQEKTPLPYTRVFLKTGDRVVNMATADGNGDYTLFNIEAGTYDLEVDAVMQNKKMTKSGVTVATNEVVFIDFEIDLTNDVEEVIIEWEPPVFSADNTTSASRMSGEMIRTTPGRSVGSALAAQEGVASVDGDVAAVRGNRSDGQQTVIDGVRVRGGSVSMSSIEEVQLIQGGIPAEYGDGTSFTVITTKQAPKEFHGSLELRGSIDGYNNFLVAADVSGPLLKGKTKHDPTRIGFLFSGEFSYTHDIYGPARGGTWVANEDVVEALAAHPLRYSTTNFGQYTLAGEYLTSESFHKVHTHKNANGWGALAQLKLDFIMGKHHNMKLSLSGVYEPGWNKSGGSMFDIGRYSVNRSNSTRLNAHFNHRVVNDTSGNAVLKNLMYDINALYYRYTAATYDPLFKKNLFDYGYIGQFTTHKFEYFDPERTDVRVNDSTTFYGAHEFLGYRDSVAFHINPDHNANNVLAQYTLDFLNEFTPESVAQMAGDPWSRETYMKYGALFNGDGPSSIYSMYSPPGIGGTSYAERDESQLAFKASVSMNLKNHELKFGYDFEKLKNSYYGIAAYSLWTLMRNEANYHIMQLDKNNYEVWDEDGELYVFYHRAVDLPSQTYFDRSLRQRLGLNPDGDDWIDIDNLSPNTFDVNMFSAEELLLGTSGGNSSMVTYYGYDHTGKKYNSKTSIEDFFNNIGPDGQKTYHIGAYEPVYMAFYLQDKFSINSLLFNVGVRVDRFDANQSVLKDPYLFREAYTVGDLKNINKNLNFVGNATDDWVVYYSGTDVYMSEADIQGGEFNTSSIVGYRNGDTWYNANGEVVVNPESDLSLYVNGPVLKNEIDQVNSITKVEASAFTDYKAQWSVMPRISFSFPVNDNSLFYAHYNIITSRPTGLRISPVDYMFIYQRNTATINNPNLKPQKSIDYEIGFRQKVGNKSAISLAAYYSEKRDMIQTYRFSGAYPTTYYSYQNMDFGTVQGFTFSFKTNRINNVTLQANYTLQFAKGTGSSADGQKAILQAGQPNLRTLTNLSFDQRHNIGVNFNYRFEDGVNYNGPKTEKVKIVDGKETVKEIEWLANTGFSLLFSAASGMPYTRSSTPYSAILGGLGTKTISGTINGSNLPWQFQADLRIDKTFMFNFNKNKKDENGKAKSAKIGYLTIYVDIQNLFNFKNIVSVYDYTGNPDDDGFLSAAAYQQNIQSQIYVPSFIWYYQMAVQNPYNYSRPIRASLGIQFGF